MHLLPQLIIDLCSSLPAGNPPTTFLNLSFIKTVRPVTPAGCFFVFLFFFQADYSLVLRQCKSCQPILMPQHRLEENTLKWLWGAMGHAKQPIFYSMWFLLLPESGHELRLVAEKIDWWGWTQHHHQVHHNLRNICSKCPGLLWKCMAHNSPQQLESLSLTEWIVLLQVKFLPIRGKRRVSEDLMDKSRASICYLEFNFTKVNSSQGISTALFAAVNHVREKTPWGSYFLFSH